MRTFLLILIVLLGTTVDAAEYAVVVARNSQIGALDVEKLRDIFLRRRSVESGVRLIPVNLLGDAEVRNEFEQHILNMDREQINRYWISNHFQGVKPPATQASLLSIKTFVERVEGAIGYLPLDMVDDSVKVIHEF